MKRGPLALAALVALALAVGFAAQQPGADSPVPSVHNTGPRGLAVLAAWLGEANVVVHDAPLTELPAGVRTVVLAVPAEAEVSPDEVARLRSFVEAGGTLVYLVPRNAAQPALNGWLDVRLGALAPLVSEPGLQDVGGTSVRVIFAGGLLAGAARLRLAADRTLAVTDEQAVAVTSDDAVWWRKLGGGEIWLAAGADLAENARLELADNALFWSHLAERGPILFDEYHHRRSTRPLPVNLAITALQLAFLAGLFMWARGPRLGPPRDAPPTLHRTSLEYVRAMAALTQRAGVEAELVEALRVSFRRRLQEELAIPQGWSVEAADAELARRQLIAPGELLAASRVSGFVALSRGLASLEQRLRQAR